MIVWILHVPNSQPCINAGHSLRGGTPHGAWERCAAPSSFGGGRRWGIELERVGMVMHRTYGASSTARIGTGIDRRVGVVFKLTWVCLI